MGILTGLSLPIKVTYPAMGRFNPVFPGVLVVRDSMVLQKHTEEWGYKPVLGMMLLFVGLWASPASHLPPEEFHLDIQSNTD